VEDGRPGPAHADHDDRRRDRKPAHLGMATMPVGDLEPVGQIHGQDLGRDHGAELGQVGLVLEPVDQAIQAEAERVSAEVVQPGAAPGGVQQPLGAEFRHHAARRRIEAAP